MTLSSALSIASSGLSAISAQLSTTSNNITNANTAGYTDKTQQVSTAVNGTQTDGVRTGVVTSNVNQYLLADMLSANSDNSAASYTDYILGQLTEAYGTSTSSTSFANEFSTLADAFSTLEATPESTTLQNAVVTAAENLANTINAAGNEIVSLRSQAQDQMTTSVNSANTDLNAIDKLNSEIVSATAQGQSVADLQDQRNSYLTDLSSQISISYYTTSSGAVQISTTGGTTLLDSTVHPLSFTANTLTASSQYVAGSTSGAPVLQGVYCDGVDITGTIGTSGTLGAAITLRDTTLMQAQTQVDEYATQLINGFSQYQVSTGTGTAATLQLFEDASNPLSDTGTQPVAAETFPTAAGASVRIEVNPEVVDNVWMVRDGNVAIDTTTNTGATQTENTNSGNATYLSALLTQEASGATATEISPLEGTLTFDTTVAALVTGASAITLGMSSLSTLSDYGTSIIGFQSTQKANASSSYTSANTYLNTATTNLNNQSGVSLDVELEKLVTLQNSYSAVAKTISTVNSMYSDLLGMVG